jgi:hypothetical protein
VSEAPFNVYPQHHTRAILEHQPYQRLGDYDLIQPGNVRVQKLTMVVDLSRKVGIVLLGRLEDYLLSR